MKNGVKSNEEWSNEEWSMELFSTVVSLIERLSIVQRLPHWRFHCIHTLYKVFILSVLSSLPGKPMGQRIATQSLPSVSTKCNQHLH